MKTNLLSQSSYKEDTSLAFWSWSIVEIKIFQEAFAIYSTNFCKIARLLDDKTCQQVACYYKENSKKFTKPSYTLVKTSN